MDDPNATDWARTPAWSGDAEQLELLSKWTDALQHDFNNFRQVVIGACDMLDLEAADESTRSIVEMIRLACGQAEGISRRLQGLAEQLRPTARRDSPR